MSICQSKMNTLYNASRTLGRASTSYATLKTNLQSAGSMGTSMYSTDAATVTAKITDLGSGYESAISTLNGRISSKYTELQNAYNTMKSEDDTHHAEKAAEEAAKEGS